MTRSSTIKNIGRAVLVVLFPITAPYFAWRLLWRAIFFVIRSQFVVTMLALCCGIGAGVWVGYLVNRLAPLLAVFGPQLRFVGAMLPSQVWTTLAVNAVVAAPIGSVFWWLRSLPRPVRAFRGPTSHGSSRWAGGAELHGGLRTSGGLLLGRVNEPAPKGLDSRYRTTKHVLTCAPTGAGKGIGCVVPNLLSYPGSVVVLDVKGENWAVTRNARQRAGQKCVALDPFGVTGQRGATVNPLATINLTDEACYSDALTVVDWLVVRSGGGEQNHWDDSAAALLQCLVLHVSSLPPERRHLGTVRELLMLPESDLLRLMETLTKDAAAFGRIARLANGYLGKADRERASVLSTAQRHTTWLDDPRASRTLEGGSEAIDFAALKHQPLSVYIIIPPDMIGTFKGWVRVVLGHALREMVRERQQPEVPVLFLVDEMAQLDYFKPLEDGISLLRGYGVTLWLLVQDLSQLQAVYPRWRSFLANTVLQAFGTQDLDTAKYVSGMLGQTTIEVVGSSSSGFLGANSSTNRSEQGRALLMPDEVRRMPTDTVFVLEQGKNPVFLRRLDYRSDPECTGMFDSNPMHEQAALQGI